MPAHRTRLIIALALGVVLALGWWVYAPGLHGPFLFDDYANLPALGATGPVDTWPTFWRYITSGHADPTGRPLALLSFLVDAHNWPADPLPFKRTNVLLHLFNGLLLALLLRRLGHTLYAFPQRKADQGAQRRLRPSNAASDAIRASHRNVETRDASSGYPNSRLNGASATTTAAPSCVPEPPKSAIAMWRIELAAVLGAALWLLHPLLVSTTLYIVQREAMLPATFTLLGLLAWLNGRSRLRRGQRARGLIWITLGLGACTLLGVLSKANGILLPALALVIEYTVLRHHARNVGADTPAHVRADATATAAAQPIQPAVADADPQVAAIPARTEPGDDAWASRDRRAYTWTMALLAWLPTTLVAGYLVSQGWRGLVHGISATRPWTLGQRLLTEPRVLMDYLGLLWMPRPFTPGLFNDHIHASTSLLSPLSTLPAMLAVLGLIVGAWLLRKRWPAVAMAVLFYFVGQSLESSTIALELYFEHRNYLPAMLMFWPLALWLCGARRGTEAVHRMDSASAPPAPVAAAGIPKSDAAAARTQWTDASDADVWSKARLVLAAVLVAGLALMTYARASLWGNAHDQALLWAQLNPDSPRAQATAAQVQMGAGASARAAARLRPLLARSPDQVQLALNLFAAECQSGRVHAATLDAANVALRTSRNSGTLLTSWFDRAIRQSAHPPCAQLNLATLDAMLGAALSNPHLRSVSGRRQDLYSLRGSIALARHDGDAALAFFNRALDQQVRIGAALQQAAMLGSAGYPALGLAHLQHFDQERHRESTPALGMPRIHAWVLQHQRYWPTEEAHLRATLRADVATQPKAPQ